jgi:hypothetical protein
MGAKVESGSPLWTISATGSFAKRRGDYSVTIVRHDVKPGSKRPSPRDLRQSRESFQPVHNEQGAQSPTVRITIRLAVRRHRETVGGISDARNV